MNASDQNKPNENPYPENKMLRRGTGRKRTQLARIENQTSLEVTFSKRRAGIFKKANELSTLTGAETALVVFTPRGKVHSFGYPDFESVTNRFFNQGTQSTAGTTNGFLASYRNASMEQYNQEIAQLERQLEAERLQLYELHQEKMRGQMQGWYPLDIDQMSYEQLKQLDQSLRNFSLHFNAELKKSKAKSPNTNHQGSLWPSTTYQTHTSTVVYPLLPGDGLVNPWENIVGTSHNGTGSSWFQTQFSEMGSNPFTLSELDFYNSGMPQPSTYTASNLATGSSSDMVVFNAGISGMLDIDPTFYYSGFAGHMASDPNVTLVNNISHSREMQVPFGTGICTNLTISCPTSAKPQPRNIHDDEPEGSHQNAQP